MVHLVCILVLKIVLYVLCRSISKPSIQVMALDHRNDVISGIAALACGIIGNLHLDHALFCAFNGCRFPYCK